MCVIPSGRPFAATLEGEAKFLAVYLDPSLVLRAAAEDAPTAPIMKADLKVRAEKLIEIQIE
jgi:hypothetical protein